MSELSCVVRVVMQMDQGSVPIDRYLTLLNYITERTRYFAKKSKILLDTENNFVRNNEQCCKKSGQLLVLTTSLSIIIQHNYFDSSTKLLF